MTTTDLLWKVLCKHSGLQRIHRCWVELRYFAARELPDTWGKNTPEGACTNWDRTWSVQQSQALPLTLLFLWLQWMSPDLNKNEKREPDAQSSASVLNPPLGFTNANLPRAMVWSGEPSIYLQACRKNDLDRGRVTMDFWCMSPESQGKNMLLLYTLLEYAPLK